LLDTVYPENYQLDTAEEKVKKIIYDDTRAKIRVFSQTKTNIAHAMT
jgi:hypothetical protein